jgi:myo-inositol-hexaphosphate 3-phosphohydrolase
MRRAPSIKTLQQIEGVDTDHAGLIRQLIKGEIDFDNSSLFPETAKAHERFPVTSIHPYGVLLAYCEIIGCRMYTVMRSEANEEIYAYINNGANAFTSTLIYDFETDTYSVGCIADKIFGVPSLVEITSRRG